MATTHASAPSEPISQRAYARRRGVVVEAVSKAIRSGRLVRSVVMVDGVAKIADPELADREWTENTATTRARHDREPSEDERAAAVRLVYFRARTLEQQCRELADTLVGAADWSAALTQAIGAVQQQVGRIATAWWDRCPHLTGDVVARASDALAEALEPLAALETGRRADDEAPLPVEPEVHSIESPDALSLGDASTLEKQWRAYLAELAYHKRRGLLLVAADVQAPLADALGMVKMRALGAPNKLKQQFAHLTLDDLAELETVVREALAHCATAEAA